MNGLNIVGKTVEGKILVDGVFDIFDRKGMPLEIIVEMLNIQNMMPCWMNFYNDAVKAGWKEKTIFNKLGSAIGDVYGREFWEGVQVRLVKYSNTKNKQ